jgi:hypothetical protein
VSLFGQNFTDPVIDFFAPIREFAIHAFAPVFFRAFGAFAVDFTACVGARAFYIDFFHYAVF